MADVHRPLISEEAITGSPYNVAVIEFGIHAWILDTSRTRLDPNRIVCHYTKEQDNLYHIHNPSTLITFQKPVSISYAW